MRPGGILTDLESEVLPYELAGIGKFTPVALRH